MFARSLSNLTLSGDLANQAFPQIQADPFNGDMSFAATARALLLPRIGDDRIRIRYNSSTYRRSQFQNNDFKIMAMHMVRDITAQNQLTIHNLRAMGDDDRAAAFEAFDDPEHGLVASYKGFVEHETIKKFMYDNADQTKVRVYINEDLKSTIILVDSLTVRRWHLIESLLPQYFKWYFKDQPLVLGSEEHNLLKSLTVRNPTEYQRLIEEFADKYDMRGLLIKQVLFEFERHARGAQLDIVVNSLSDLHEHMRDLMEEYARLLNRADELNMQEIGLREAMNNAGAGSELVDYFNANKTLTPVRTEDTRFDFIVKTYLDSFDLDMYDKMSRRPMSHIFEGYSIHKADFKTPKARKKLLDVIFSDDPLLRVKMCAIYSLDIRGHVRTYSGYTFPADCSDRLPNPHLQHHACIGNHERFIIERLNAGDTLGAIEQCISSAKSLNLGEGLTVRPFLADLFNSDDKILELADGTSMNPVEALKWLEERESEQAKEE